MVGLDFAVGLAIAPGLNVTPGLDVEAGLEFSVALEFNMGLVMYSICYGDILFISIFELIITHVSTGCCCEFGHSCWFGLSGWPQKCTRHPYW